MGRIKKAASSKHDATVSPALSEFASKACSLPLIELPTHLSSFPRRWPFPRGDLYHWIDLLDRFDGILERFIDHYSLKSPQVRPFDCSFLVAEHGGDIQSPSFGPQGDVQLIQSILDFSRLLLEKCGNRSLYGSGDRLNNLLNTTSLSLLHTTLRLALCLAQRVNARQRPNSFAPGSAMLKNYYAMDLDNLQHLALPLRNPRLPTKATPSSTPVKVPKGKDRPTRPSNLRKSSSGIANANDLVRLAGSSTETATQSRAEWEPWAVVEITAQKPGSEEGSKDDDQTNSFMPDTPTRSSPLRRSSDINGMDTDRASEEPGRSSRSTVTQPNQDTSPLRVTIEPEEIHQASVEELVKTYSTDLPPASQYELLTKCRAAKALMTSTEARQELLAVRLLAVSNLSYVYSEPWFLSKVIQHESEEPKRWQLVSQLAEILSYACTDPGIPLYIQTLALGTLRAFSKHKAKLHEILTALSINVNHGALLSAIRKGLEDMATDHDETDNEDGDEWREAVFSLLHTLVLMSPPPTRHGESFVPATMILRYVDVLNLRTDKAQRVYLRVLEFFETFCNTVKDGLTVLSANRAIEAIADLINFEVTSSLKQVEDGKGLAKEYRTQSTDYSIPYFNQQTIRFLLPFVDGVIGQGGTTAERILRNLIDSPPFLEALKQIMENSAAFGAHVWSSGIKLMSNFLHNEPTSYSVLAEAGLTQSFLSSIGAQAPPQKPRVEAQSSEEGNGDETTSEGGDTNMGGVDSASRTTKTINATEKVGDAKVGILASPEAISSVSQAFSAICLTTTGFNSFKASGALEIFFDLFQSPAHVKSMTEASYLQSIGNTFDEFARHHPGMRSEILSTVIVMVARLRALCKSKTLEVGAGTKLWVDGLSGKVEVAGGTTSLAASTEAFGSDSSPADYEIRLPNGDKLVIEPSHSFSDLNVQKVTEDERDEYGLTVSDYISPVMWFLLGFFENQNLCTSFVDHGAVELIMDIATAPSLPYDVSQDGNLGNSPLDMAQVIHMMADTKPHLVLPSLMHRILRAVRSLEDFTTKQPDGASCFFDPLIGMPSEDSKDQDKWVRDNGTNVARNLASCLNLTRIFHEVYSTPMYHTRQSQQPSPFNHSNLVDSYVELCHRLGEIHSACTREAIMLQERTPKAWKEETRLKDFGTGVDEADELLGLTRTPTGITGNGKDESGQPAMEKAEDKDAQLEQDKQLAAFRNVKILRSLLSQVPFTITQFFQVLGMGLVPKRRMDLNAKQNVTEVADAIAQALIQEFDPPFFRSAEHFPSDEKFREHKFAYLIVVLASLSAIVLDLQSPSPHSPATTSVLIAVKKAHGIERVRELGNMFYDEVNEFEESAKKEDSKSSPPSPMDISLSGLKMILNFFSLLTSSKTVVDATQANALKSPDRDRPYCFVPSQLLLELRMEVLPLVRKIWANNTFIERASNNTIEGLIFALRHILEGDSEADAYKASDNVPPSLLPSPRRFMPNRDKLMTLKDMGFEEDLVREALFRCNNARDASEDYCRAYERNPRVPRNPVRPSDLETSTPDPRSTPRRESSEMSVSRSDSNAPPVPSARLREILSMTTALNMPEPATQESDIFSDPSNGVNAESAEDLGTHMAMSLDNILNPGEPSGDSNRHSQAQPSDMSKTSKPQPRKNTAIVTVEDIEAQRVEIRSDLAERCLDVLNIHHNVTFELAELITAASNHLSLEERADFRTTVGSLLVSTVVSTQVELEAPDNTQTTGKRVAAHAHLLALLLQEKEMYSECLDSLKDNFTDLVKFIKVAPAPDGKPTESSSPWVGQILLVFERMLSDDAEPRELSWNPDTPDAEPTSGPLTKDVVSPDEKKQLFDAVLDVLPRIGKDTALALSVTRVLVILTRDRSLATTLGEKRNLQRLFVMIKQLGGATNDRLRGAFMINLRHIIEDEEIIRQIMRSEIVATFENRSIRQADTIHYPRNLYHLSLRAPQIFVEVTSEKLKIQNYKEHQRPQDLVLKSEGKNDESHAASTSAPQQADHDQALETTESTHGDETDGKPKSNLKLPVIEHPDGVIHFLLSELMSYKDVEDKEVIAVQADKDQPVDASSDTDSESTPADIPFPRSQPSGPNSSGEIKTEKGAFKAEDHPIYIYRCFLLQCLTELLHSYNRTKIEFISFSRRADPFAVTPSKARSGVLHYFLQNLIPLKSLNHTDTHQHKKKLTVSDWAMRVIIALCSKTGEHGNVSPRDRYNFNLQAVNDNDDEQELNVVREFVLQHALKAFKDANGSLDPPDAKYARMLGLAELFNKLLARPSLSDGEAGANNNSYKTIAKMMFQKNFISLLTASIADLDLSFPGSKRLAKSILKPLDQLTSAALQLSLHSDVVISSPLGQAEEDQISSASSVSEMDDEREETPDLFRNSALGMLDPNRQEGSDSDEDDEDDDEDETEMYEEDYDDEMEYEEDMAGLGDDGEVVSDEDVDEMEDHGPVEGIPGDVPLDLELVMEGEDGTVDTDDDESDDSEDDDEDLDDEEIEMDEDDAIMAGEINGDDENASLADDDGDIEWESDHEDDDHDHDHEVDLDNDDADIDDAVDQATTAAGNGPPGGPNPGAGPLSNILQVLGGLRDGENPLEDLLGQEMEETMDEDDDNDDDDGDDLDENDEDDAPYQTLEEILDDESSAPWAWDPIAPGSWPPRPHHHHHHHHFRGPGGFPAIGGGPVRGLPISSLGRTRHIHSTHPGNDDGTNPLLQRNNGNLQGLPGTMPPMDIFPGPTGGFMISSSMGSADVFEMVMQAVQRGDGRIEMTQNGGRFDIRFDGLPSDFRGFMRNMGPSTSHGGNGDRNDPSTAVKFRAAVTVSRWQEEAKIVFGGSYGDKVTRLQNALLRVLVPPAIEEEKAREKKRQEEARKREEEQREREHQERLAREEAEKKRKEEEREAAARAAAEAAAAAAAAQASDPEGSTSADAEPMQGVQASDDGAGTSGTTVDETSEAAPAEAAPRVYTTIRGRQLDITDLAIDAQFLEELPEEIREEVIMQQYAEQRHQAQEQGQPPTEINPEFLDALPEEIREELLAQEINERRRREREASHRRAAESGGPARAQEMNPDDFMASLDPSLRRSILADQSDEIIAGLAPEFAAEARQMFQSQLRHMNRIGLGREPREDQANIEQQPQKEVKKQVVQMVDKAGVATLLRLMFMPHHGSTRTALHNILNNICEHRQTRGEVVSLLLLILQDGTADVSAVERSLAHLSLRAKTSSAQKTPQPLKRTLTLQSNQAGSEVTPIMIVQQCLAALESLTSYNPHISPVFLRELEPSSHKSKSAKKGKGKEDRASKFAINALLSLLDRSLITENAGCMDTLAKLLLEITKPLPWLLKKDKPDETTEVQKTATGVQETSSAPQESLEQSILSVIEGPPASQNDIAMTEAPLAVPEVAQPPSESQAPAESSEAAPVASGAEKQKSSEDQKAKKAFEPPIIPDQNLRLVVRVLAAREMNAKIFQNTLSTITYLSILPRAKEVFGKELVSQAESLSQNILPDLNGLLAVLQNAQSGPEVHGPAVEKFTTPGADQSKFLRVLMAVDYLFSVKRGEDARGKTEEEVSEEKEGFLNALYGSAGFGPLWSKLSDCLTIIRQKEGMTSVSTILLSLIESLMVVCKNTSLKDTPISRSLRERSVQSPISETGVENMFFNFTEEHRKVLNELVRMNPKLMTGNFSVLVKNPKVLEFDNKRSYFNRQIHTRPRDARHHQPPLQLSVRRDQVFLDSFKSLYFKSAEEMKYGKLSIRFHGEEGVDAGGVTREWFQVLARGMFNPNYALFIPVASDRTTFHPNRLSGVNNEHLMFFKFIGRIIGKALYEGRVLDCHFSRAVYKCILGKSVSIKDMETLDLDYYKSLVWMLENDITDIITETFSVETDAFGETQIIDLIENGRNIPVTEENKQEYVQLVVEYRLTGSVKEQLENFLKGFHDIIPAELIAIFNEQELELLISGLPDIDIDDWKANTEYHNYSASSQQIQWFWRAVRSFDKEEQAKLLQFVTGTSKVPLNGFKELEGMNGFSRFNIHKDYGNKDRLPSSHTCFNQLDLPEYDSYETLRQRLYMAMTTGSEYFGFA